jgi:succinylglutamate desuccinylase
MVQVYNPTLQKSITVDRIIGKIEGFSEGPTLVFFSGIHGNEPAGVLALEETLNKIDPEKVTGTIYGLSGNLKALEAQKRYVDQDLNRLWLEPELHNLENKDHLDNEEQEQVELFKLIKEIFKKNKAPFYFFDLHTTSVKTAPFITINDAIINRKFSRQFPVPIVLGIEEYLNGPLLSYINSKGYVSLGFESGQHDQMDAITNSIAFIYLCVKFTNSIDRKNIPNFTKYYNQLKRESRITSGFYEVIDIHKIKPNDSFKMLNGFENFQSINKGEILALSNLEKIKSKYNGKIFMPLYQTQGSEGFFIIKKIATFFLKLSIFLRRFKFDELLILLPGVSWTDPKKQALYVNLKTARFLAKPMFHLLGYRSKYTNKTHMKLFNRERTAKTKMYKEETWFKSRI